MKPPAIPESEDVMAKRGDAEIIELLSVSASGYEVAVATLRDYIDGVNPINEESLRLAKRTIYGCESQGQRGLADAIAVLVNRKFFADRPAPRRSKRKER